MHRVIPHRLTALLCLFAHLSVCATVGAADLVLCNYPGGEADVEVVHSAPHQPPEAEPTEVLPTAGLGHVDGSAANSQGCEDDPLVVHEDFLPSERPEVPLLSAEIVKAHPLFQLDGPTVVHPFRYRFGPDFTDLPSPRGRLQGVVLLI